MLTKSSSEVNPHERDRKQCRYGQFARHRRHRADFHHAHDVDRATAFYHDVLGLPHLFRAGQPSFFDYGGVRLMLDKPEKPEFDHPSSILYFQVGEAPLTSALSMPELNSKTSRT